MSTVLDVCCGSRSFYFDKDDQRVHFNDIRREDVQLCDGRTISINPDTTWDFTNLPCPDESFSLVVFDPPHLLHAGDTSWLTESSECFHQLGSRTSKKDLRSVCEY